jgi:hypothetical protein
LKPGDQRKGEKGLGVDRKERNDSMKTTREKRRGD